MEIYTECSLATYPVMDNTTAFNIGTLDCVIHYSGLKPSSKQNCKDKMIGRLNSEIFIQQITIARGLMEQRLVFLPKFKMQGKVEQFPL